MWKETGDHMLILVGVGFFFLVLILVVLITIAEEAEEEHTARWMNETHEKQEGGNDDL